MPSRLFWPLVLVAAGVLFLLDNFNLLPGSAWNWLWPLLLIFFGLSLLLRRGGAPEPIEDSVSLDGATSARLNFQHGAGVLDLRSGAGPDELFHGEFAGGLDKRLDRQGDHLDVTLKAREQDWTQWMVPWNWGRRGLDWYVRLSPQARLALLLETGASDTRLNLTDLRVTELTIKTGASSTHVSLPANAGSTTARIASGAASVTVAVPPGVAARIRGSVGVGSLDVDTRRFPKQAGGGYESPDYDTATNRVDLSIESGVGSVSIA